MGPGEFLNINFFTALFTLLNTIALFLVLKKFLFKPVMKMIADRQQEIDDMYSRADKAKADAEAAALAEKKRIEAEFYENVREQKELLKKIKELLEAEK